MSPQDSLKAIHMSDDFHVELFASEPDVMSPVEMVFDENGKKDLCRRDAGLSGRSAARQAGALPHPSLAGQGRRWKIRDHHNLR